MPTTYQISLYTPFGVQLAVIDTFYALAYARTTNVVGSLQLVVPDTIPLSYFQRDGQIAVERDGVLALDTRWLISEITQQRDGPRVTTIINAVDANDLLRRRIIDYPAGDSEAVKIGAADDMMKEIVRENLSDQASDTARILPASLFSVTADTTQASVLNKAFAYRSVLTTLQELADASTTAGTWLAFDTTWTGQLYQFNTYPLWRGVDHTFPGGINPVVLSAENGALIQATYATDYSEEITRAIAGGQASQQDRLVGRATDTARSTLSPFSLIEGFTNASSGGGGLTQDEVDDEAQAALWAGRPRVTFACEVNADAAGVAYGVQYGWGDVVTAQAFGQSIDCRVDGVSVTFEAGKETIDLVLRSVT